MVSGVLVSLVGKCAKISPPEKILPVQKGVLVFVFIGLFCGSVFAQVDTGWVRTWRGPGPANDGIIAMTVDRQGDVCAVGYTVNAATGQDIVVLKYATDGVLQWAVSYDQQALADYPYGIAVDRHGNVYVCGYVTTSQTGMDFITIKFNSNGVLQWANRYNGTANTGDVAYAIALDTLGNVYVTGYANNISTGEDFTTIKYNSSGSQQWVAASSRPNIDRAQFLTIDNQGNAYVLGYVLPGPDLYLIKYSATGSQQWSVSYNGTGNGADYPSAIGLDRDGNCYVTGYSWGAGSARMDYVTIKYSASGSQQWVARYNGSGNDYDYPYGMAVTENGQVYVTGYSRGAGSFYDFVTIKYSSSGTQLWVERYDAGNNEYARALSLDSSGNIYVTGYCDAPNYDYLTISYAPDGNQRWATTYNGAGNGNDMANAVKNDRWGNVYIGGVSYGGNANGNDGVVIKYIQPDVVAQRVLRPQGFLDTSAAIYPLAMVANKGTAPVDFWAFCRIGRPGGAVVYTDSVFVAGLGVGESTTVDFAEWRKPHFLGPYFARCSTYRLNDADWANNVTQVEFFIVSGPYGWIEATSLPDLPSGKAPRDGAALTYCPSLNRIYAIKGNKTSDFYYYNPTQRNWVIMPAVPAGSSGKAPGKGACLASDEQGNVYLVRGNSTLEFWRYNSDSGWTELYPIQSGSSGKTVKGGSDAVYVPNDGCIYFLKGYRNEFYRYRLGTGGWENLPPAPMTKWDKGSFIVFDDDSLCIYACRAKYNELWRFDLLAGTWDTLRVLQKMPFSSKSGQRAKLKEGGCGAYFHRSIYALKGANTNQFWRYDIDGDSWVEIDTMPSWGSTQKNKRVKAGADLVYAGDAFYALKGNKTREFWRYAIPLAPTSFSNQLLSEKTTIQSHRLIEPTGKDNCLIGKGLVRIALPKTKAQYVLGVVYDPAGRRRMSGIYRVRGGFAEMDLNQLQSGVYFICIRCEDKELNRRIVLTW